MSIRLKNLRPGVLILADSGLRLGPGEMVEITTITPQIQKALAAGLLAQLEAESTQPEASEPASEPASENGEPEAAGRRTQKRVPLDALKRKNEEITGGAE